MIFQEQTMLIAIVITARLIIVYGVNNEGVRLQTGCGWLVGGK